MARLLPWCPGPWGPVVPQDGSRGLSLHFRFQVKYFYLCQLAYWLHALPELYFQKVRKVRSRRVFTRTLGMLEVVCSLTLGKVSFGRVQVKRDNS